MTRFDSSGIELSRGKSGVGSERYAESIGIAGLAGSGWLALSYNAHERSSAWSVLVNSGNDVPDQYITDQTDGFSTSDYPTAWWGHYGHWPWTSSGPEMVFAPNTSWSTLNISDEDIAGDFSIQAAISDGEGGVWVAGSNRNGFTDKTRINLYHFNSDGLPVYFRAIYPESFSSLRLSRSPSGDVVLFGVGDSTSPRLISLSTRPQGLYSLCVEPNPDPDGDGLGWENHAPCQIAKTIAPPAPALVSPSNINTASLPTYVWNAVESPAYSGSVSYHLWVNDRTGNRVATWYQADQLNCAGVATICAVTPTVPVNGATSWWVRASNDAGSGPWSERTNFHAEIGPTAPEIVTLIAPTTGIVTTTTPSYSWQPDPQATWYYLWVNDSSGNVIKRWYSAPTAGCAALETICHVSPSERVTGAVRWWVQAWNSTGVGPWSLPGTATITTGISTPANLIAPSGSITDSQPTFIWSAVDNAFRYYLWINGDNGVIHRQWFTATTAGCGNGTGNCSVTPVVTISGGNLTWWIRAQSSSEYGPWSDSLSTTIQ